MNRNFEQKTGANLFKRGAEWDRERITNYDSSTSQLVFAYNVTIFIRLELKKANKNVGY